MKTGPFEAYLAAHPLFRDLGTDRLAALSECASEVQFDEGQSLFRQGEAAERCYLIRQGNVSLEIQSPTRGAMSIQTLGPGEVLGWSWLFPPYRWHFDARATEPTGALALDGKCLRERFERDPKLGYELMKRFSALMYARMQAARLQITDIYGPTSA